MAQVGVVMGLRSKSTIAYDLRRLEGRGVLVRDGYGWRACGPAVQVAACLHKTRPAVRNRLSDIAHRLRIECAGCAIGARRW
ncbi:hypothetical protein QFZ75_008099 [Streptomyces sp. V3I8]|uniref:hypothetical protein n=1 Tax=Streptomyces sp. V3I8 TaxID=3042279 RepID=UPI00278035CD|nr:hypothetical protein [Streptomyces sp. V3I8]MDQ1041597.1 hypothetical protein [Streptomyces sp. V3I8]